MTSNRNGNAIAVTAKSAATGLSKQELMKQAIKQLGKDAKPLQIQAHIKDKFGVEIATNHISASKTEILRKMEGGAKPATSTAAAKPAAPTPSAKPTPKPAVQKPVAQKSPTQTTTPKAVAPARVVGHEAGNGKKTAGISLHDIQAAKDLVGRVGAVQLRELIDLLAK